MSAEATLPGRYRILHRLGVGDDPRAPLEIPDQPGVVRAKLREAQAAAGG